MNQSSDTDGAWSVERARRFQEWSSAHPQTEARVGELKQATARLVLARKREVEESWPKMCAALAEQSVRVSETERAENLQTQREAASAASAGDHRRAAELYGEMLQSDPANVDAHYGLGLALRQLGDLAGAARALCLAASFPKIGSDNGYFASMLALQALPPPADPRLSEPSVIFRVEGAPADLWDSPEAPPMTIIPAGEYTMGSLPSEPLHVANETPHRVTIGYPLAVSTYDVTRGEFAAFVAATGYDAESGGDCQVFIDGKFTVDPKASWRAPGFEQTDDEPVVCVSYLDGVAYAEWLSGVTGQTYRLPSEAEWEYAVRGGTSTSYYWGETLGLRHAHCDGCSPGAPLLRTIKGGAFPPNPFGLYDVCGNVWTWLADAWNPSYVGAPSDGSAWDDGTTVLRGRRGGSWFNISEARPGDVRAPNRLRSAGRFGSLPHLRFSSFGLRVVRDL